jgi:penicillin-binding protein 2
MPKRKQNFTDPFTRRALLVGVAQGAILAVLAGRLGWLQISQGEKYKTLAENNRINIKILPPSRGPIVDRFGVPLAINVQDFQVLVTPDQAGDVRHALQLLRRHIPIEDRDIRRVLRESKNNSPYIPIQVRNNLTWDEVALVELNLPKLPGISVAGGEVRNYPFKEDAAHLVGYVGRVSEKEMTDDPLLRLPGFQIGKNGLEKYFEQDLRGIPGKIEVEVNVKGRQIRELNKIQSVSGARLILSIDAELQRSVQLRLSQERSASAIIMDVETGAVYAMASHPSFNPNSFAEGISTMEWEQLRDDVAKPLNNKVISGLYPPGSTFKMITAMAGLESKIIDANWSIHCPGHYDFGNHRFHCWKRGGHGSVNLRKALAESCDTYFYKMSTQVGIDKIAEMARRLGLGQTYDIGLAEEKRGLVPDTHWKRKTRQEPWMQGETIVASIGQGYLQSSPLQLVTMVARLVNGGYQVEPWLASTVGTRISHKTQFQKINFNPADLQLIKDGMDAVLLPGGTAYGSRIATEGEEMGGKTGTSQVRRITKAQRAAGLRKQEDMPWEQRHHALFVGYAPKAKPKYACCVVVEHGGSGSGAAAPIARDIMMDVQKRKPADRQAIL